MKKLIFIIIFFICALQVNSQTKNINSSGSNLVNKTTLTDSLDVIRDTASVHLDSLQSYNARIIAVSTSISDHLIDLANQISTTNTITVDYAFTDILPANYIVEYIIFQETAGNTAILDLGTTAGASDVFKNITITASQFTTVPIFKMYSTSAAQSFYLNDDDAGSSWNSASVNVTYVLKRIF